jgi:hypothetical protein
VVEVSQTTLYQEDEPCLSSKGSLERLQLVDECDGFVSRPPAVSCKCIHRCNILQYNNVCCTADCVFCPKA